MSEVTDVWLLAVALDGEDTFWLCEPTNMKPLARDWKSTNCRWLYPVVENVSRFADLSGFESTDAVYEVEWAGVSKVLRAATLTWNVKCKRQKMGRTTYVFVPAEEMKLLDEAYSKFAKLEAMKPPPPRAAPAASSSYEDAHTSGSAFTAGPAGTQAEPQEHRGANARAISPPATSLTGTYGDAPLADTTTVRAATDTSMKKDEEAENDDVKASQQSDGGGGDVSVTSSSVARQGGSRAHHHSSSSYYSAPTHKRKTPHRGTTTYQAPVHSKPMGDHRSDEAFDWPEMFVVHRGSVDYLCPRATDNSYGFRLDRVLHNGFPVFLLFSSSKNNSETIDASARGVPVYEKAKLSGEGGEGSIRSSVLVLTRLSSKKHQSYYRKNTGRRLRRRRSVSTEDSITEEEDEEDKEDYDDDDDIDSDTYEDEEEVEDNGDDDKPMFLPQERRVKAKAKPTSPPPKKSKAEPTLPIEEATAPTRRRGQRSAAQKEEAPLQAVSVNFWTDPQGVTPAVSQLAREFAFHAEGADTPQTVVFSDGVCVTYTAATAAKHAAQERKRSTAKPGYTAASTEDSDLSMLNEHILNAFAQVRRESA
ncbi:hypothetical protein ABL78_1940 [Leptomonas seymouri]|uniref:Uncharacterized protein n=1 Tax=Leptomonas seymouri TaxID=5684 RepID=A0A0N1I1J1_LEPSE|nr:hypothetical protein ABL78_1940 [Leptomonas seymouri]|eukprot:KPI88974.1 hypothetical protein ABL78_1940 [Leptomonas seymouri]